MTESLDPRLLATLRRFFPDPEEWREVLAGEPLLESTSLDSLSVVNLVTELELLFEVRFEPETLGSALRDIYSLAAFLEAAQDRRK
jgi:acyl carrier protein